MDGDLKNALPSRFAIGETVMVQLAEGLDDIEAMIVGVHFSAHKVRYDVETGALNGILGPTLRDIDSVWVKPLTGG